MDGSDSIKTNEFEEILNWVLLTVDSYDPSTRAYPLHLTVVQFSDLVKLELKPFPITSDSFQVQSYIQNITQFKSGTKTYTALEFVNTNVYPLLRKSSYKILITMTDGDPSEDRNEATVATARSNFDLMIAVGIGQLNMTKLSDFSCTQDHVISIEHVEELADVVKTIKSKVCLGINEAVEGNVHFII